MKIALLTLLFLGGFLAGLLFSKVSFLKEASPKKTQSELISTENARSKQRRSKPDILTSDRQIEEEGPKGIFVLHGTDFDKTIAEEPFHSYKRNEVYEKLQNLKWFGLTASPYGCALEETIVEIEPFTDQVTNIDGYRVKSATPYEFLFTGVSTIKAGSIPCFKDGGVIFPGKSLTVTLKDQEYSFSATGNVQISVNEDLSSNYTITQFQLFLSTTVNGQIINQKLIDEPKFDYIGGQIAPYILWIGDLDGDGKLDALFNLATHYNSNKIGLFLSSFARNGELMHLVATQESSTFQ